MRTSTLTVALVSVLLVAGAGTVGALTTGPLQPQASPTGTTTGTTTGTGTGTSTGTATAPTAGGPSITFDDQNSTGETVLVQSATLSQNGFVVIYNPNRPGNATNQIIGASYLLNAGTTDNIRVQLDQPLNQTTSLTAVVHVDSNGNGQFDFASSNGQQDPPLMQGGGRIVDIAQVTVQSSGTSGTNQTATGATTTASTGGSGGNGGTQTAAGGAGGGSANASSNGNASGGGGGSGAFGPGFGLVIAVVALLAVALLAVRRN